MLKVTSMQTSKMGMICPDRHVQAFAMATIHHRHLDSDYHAVITFCYGPIVSTFLLLLCILHGGTLRTCTVATPDCGRGWLTAIMSTHTRVLQQVYLWSLKLPSSKLMSFSRKRVKHENGIFIFKCVTLACQC